MAGLNQSNLKNPAADALGVRKKELQMGDYFSEANMDRSLTDRSQIRGPGYEEDSYCAMLIESLKNTISDSITKGPCDVCLSPRVVGSSSEGNHNHNNNTNQNHSDNDSVTEGGLQSPVNSNTVLNHGQTPGWWERTVRIPGAQQQSLDSNYLRNLTNISLGTQGTELVLAHPTNTNSDRGSNQSLTAASPTNHLYRKFKSNGTTVNSTNDAPGLIPGPLDSYSLSRLEVPNTTNTITNLNKNVNNTTRLSGLTRPSESDVVSNKSAINDLMQALTPRAMVERLGDAFNLAGGSSSSQAGGPVRSDSRSPVTGPSQPGPGGLTDLSYDYHGEAKSYVFRNAKNTEGMNGDDDDIDNPEGGPNLNAANTIASTKHAAHAVTLKAQPVKRSANADSESGTNTTNNRGSLSSISADSESPTSSPKKKFDDTINRHLGTSPTDPLNPGVPLNMNLRIFSPDDPTVGVEQRSFVAIDNLSTLGPGSSIHTLSDVNSDSHNGMSLLMPPGLTTNSNTNSTNLSCSNSYSNSRSTSTDITSNLAPSITVSSAGSSGAAGPGNPNPTGGPGVVGHNFSMLQFNTNNFKVSQPSETSLRTRSNYSDRVASPKATTNHTVGPYDKLYKEERKRFLDNVGFKIIFMGFLWLKTALFDKEVSFQTLLTYLDYTVLAKSLLLKLATIKPLLASLLALDRTTVLNKYLIPFAHEIQKLFYRPSHSAVTSSSWASYRTPPPPRSDLFDRAIDVVVSQISSFSLLISNFSLNSFVEDLVSLLSTASFLFLVAFVILIGRELANFGGRVRVIARMRMSKLKSKKVENSHEIAEGRRMRALVDSFSSLSLGIECAFNGSFETVGTSSGVLACLLQLLTKTQSSTSYNSSTATGGLRPGPGISNGSMSPTSENYSSSGPFRAFLDTLLNSLSNITNLRIVDRRSLISVNTPTVKTTSPTVKTTVSSITSDLGSSIGGTVYTPERRPTTIDHDMYSETGSYSDSNLKALAASGGLKLSISGNSSRRRPTTHDDVYGTDPSSFGSDPGDLVMNLKDDFQDNNSITITKGLDNSIDSMPGDMFKSIANRPSTEILMDSLSEESDITANVDSLFRELQQANETTPPDLLDATKTVVRQAMLCCNSNLAESESLSYNSQNNNNLNLDANWYLPLPSNLFAKAPLTLDAFKDRPSRPRRGAEMGEICQLARQNIRITGVGGDELLTKLNNINNNSNESDKIPITSQMLNSLLVHKFPYDPLSYALRNTDFWILIKSFDWGLRYALNFVENPGAPGERGEQVLDLNTPLKFQWVKVKKQLVERPVFNNGKPLDWVRSSSSDSDGTKMSYTRESLTRVNAVESLLPDRDSLDLGLAKLGVVSDTEHNPSLFSGGESGCSTALYDDVPGSSSEAASQFGYSHEIFDGGRLMKLKMNLISNKPISLLTPIRDSETGRVFTRKDYTSGREFHLKLDSDSENANSSSAQAEPGFHLKRVVNPLILYLDDTKTGYPYRRLTHTYADLDWFLGVPNVMSVQLFIQSGNWLMAWTREDEEEKRRLEDEMDEKNKKKGREVWKTIKENLNCKLSNGPVTADERTHMRGSTTVIVTSSDTDYGSENEDQENCISTNFKGNNINEIATVLKTGPTTLVQESKFQKSRIEVEEAGELNPIVIHQESGGILREESSVNPDERSTGAQIDKIPDDDNFHAHLDIKLDSTTIISGGKLNHDLEEELSSVSIPHGQTLSSAATEPKSWDEERFDVDQEVGDEIAQGELKEEVQILMETQEADSVNTVLNTISTNTVPGSRSGPAPITVTTRPSSHNSRSEGERSPFYVPPVPQPASTPPEIIISDIPVTPTARESAAAHDSVSVLLTERVTDQNVNSLDIGPDNHTTSTTVSGEAAAAADPPASEPVEKEKGKTKKVVKPKSGKVKPTFNKKLDLLKLKSAQVAAAETHSGAATPSEGAFKSPKESPRQLSTSPRGEGATTTAAKTGAAKKKLATVPKGPAAGPAAASKTTSKTNVSKTAAASKTSVTTVTATAGPKSMSTTATATTESVANSLDVTVAPASPAPKSKTSEITAAPAPKPKTSEITAGLHPPKPPRAPGALSALKNGIKKNLKSPSEKITKTAKEAVGKASKLLNSPRVPNIKAKAKLKPSAKKKVSDKVSVESDGGDKLPLNDNPTSVESLLTYPKSSVAGEGLPASQFY